MTRPSPHSAFRVPCFAFVLLGPTGAGKSPLGEWLEATGWGGRRCAHFDFGAQLRRAAAGDLPPADLAVVRDVLARNALLEDHQFGIAERILRAFISGRALAPGDVVVLNGLPRHVGQAAALEPWVSVGRVVELRCTPDVVRARIRRDTGGDRAGRTDDSLAEIERKLGIFAKRTAPLLDYYRARGVSMTGIDVTAGMTAAEMGAALRLQEG